MQKVLITGMKSLISSNSRILPSLTYLLPRYQQASIQNLHISGSNLNYLESLYQEWKENKIEVTDSIKKYFLTLENQIAFDNSLIQIPDTKEQGTKYFDALPQQASSLANQIDVQFTTKVVALISNYQKYGAEIANLDPLQLDFKDPGFGKFSPDSGANKLEEGFYNFSKEDYEKQFILDSQIHKGFLNWKKQWNLKELIQKLKETYCGNIGYEFRHIAGIEKQNYIIEQIEVLNEQAITAEQKKNILNKLIKIETFSEFLYLKYKVQKRFGIEGLSTVIQGMMTLVDSAAKYFIENMYFGMAHRGRLNALHNIFGKSMYSICSEFGDEYEIEKMGEIPEEVVMAGDVKYHLGATYDRKFPNGHQMRLQVIPNASHLEAVNPVLYGKVRANQDFICDSNGDKSVGVLLHGDASFTGQGIVYETLQLQDLNNYSPRGVIHIICNNQIGFTATPKESRSTYFCTDIAKAMQAPIFHVNSDDPEAIDKVFKLAFDYRQKFKSNVIIDVVGYRYFGHNEQDQPLFTNPLMYNKIYQRVKFIIYFQLFQQVQVSYIRKLYKEIIK